MANDRVRVTEGWLRQWCSGSVAQLAPARAYEVAYRLRNLAGWWLRPEVLQQAVAHARQLDGMKWVVRCWERGVQLPTERGACWIAVVNKYPDELGLLRAAYALPLRWAKRQDHDPRLPAGLLALADQVLGELQRLGEVSEAWALLPGDDPLLCGLDLSSLEGQWDSGWAPLAVGLLLAAWEGQPDATLWASGAWDPKQGIQAVEGLEAKLALAGAFKAKSFFVPEPQAQSLRDHAQAHGCTTAIIVLRCGTNDLRKALGEYLEHVDLPIGPGAHLKAKRAEHFNRIQDDETARRFYQKHMLRDVVEGLRQRLPPGLLPGSKKLIMIVSRGFDLPRLAVRVIRPTKCLLLHDEELADEAARLKAEFAQEMPQFPVASGLFSGRKWEELLAAFRQQIEQFAQQAAPEELVFDLTGGKRIMNLALYDAAPPGSYVICVQADFGPNRRPKPGNEDFHAWRVAGTSGQ